MAKPKGWKNEPARHSLAARGVKSIEKVGKGAELGPRRRQGGPIITINTDPGIEDVYGDAKEQFDMMMDVYDEFREFVGNKTKPGETFDEQELVGEWMDSHQSWFADDAQSQWEDQQEYLRELLQKAKFEEGDTLRVEANPVGWTGQSGFREFRWDGTPEGLLHESFGKLSSDRFMAEIFKISNGEIRAMIYHHDVPTGGQVVIKRL